MQKVVKADFCVIGGGMSGMCAALSAARNGLKVVLVHDRPVLGGNASSEVRMWIRGVSSLFPAYREGGILEEIAMDNMYYNPTMNYPVWDAVLFQIVKREENIELLLNATCNGAVCDNGHIRSVNAWQLTTYINFTIEATCFADCSGDSVLAEFIGAELMHGRERVEAFNESKGVAVADGGTMGSSCLLQPRETTKRVPFHKMPLYDTFDKTSFPYRFDVQNPRAFIGDNFWWIEKGGNRDTLRDNESIRDELIPTTYGVWNYIKNSGKFEADRWELDFVGHLAAKRESRRYVGHYVLTQNDLEQATAFDDEVAYGGWPMDVHNPDGMDTALPPNENHQLDKPYPIPYRALYAKDIDNLFFAGRNISATHLALSSTRVMATCAMMGQAVGAAAAVANKYAIHPHDVLDHIDELKQRLRNDDCYLLNTPRRVSEVIKRARHNLSDEDFARLCSGQERKIGNVDACLSMEPHRMLEFEFSDAFVSSVRIVFDNDIARECYEEKHLKQFPQKCTYAIADRDVTMPPRLVREFELSIKMDGAWQAPIKVSNHQRLRNIVVNKRIQGIRFVGMSTYGSRNIRLYSIDVLTP